MVESELPENIADLPEIKPPSATKTSKPKRKSPGRPFTKENAKAMQLSAAKAKAMRKQARADMLNALCTQLNLGDELVKAFRSNDEKRIAIVEKALHIVGLTHQQSEDAVAKKLDVKTDNTTKGTLTLKIEEA